MQKIIKILLLFFLIKMNFHSTALGMPPEITENDTLAVQDTIQTIETIQQHIQAILAHNLRLKKRESLLTDLAKQINVQIDTTIAFAKHHPALTKIPLITTLVDELTTFQGQFNMFIICYSENTYTLASGFLSQLQHFIYILKNLQQQILKQYQQEMRPPCSLYDLLVRTITLVTLCFWIYQIKTAVNFEPYRQ